MKRRPGQGPPPYPPLPQHKYTSQSLLNPFRFCFPSLKRPSLVQGTSTSWFLSYQRRGSFSIKRVYKSEYVSIHFHSLKRKLVHPAQIQEENGEWRCDQSCHLSSEINKGGKAGLNTASIHGCLALRLLATRGTIHSKWKSVAETTCSSLEAMFISLRPRSKKTESKRLGPREPFTD